MMRSPLALLIALLPLSVEAQVVYKCIDASADTVFSSSREKKNCKEIGPPEPKEKPKYFSAAKLSLGMTKSKVLSVSGFPLNKKISRRHGSLRELWSYGMGNALVIENGIVVEILSNE